MSDDRNWNVDTEEGMKNALAWMTWHIGRMSDGGVWTLPRSLSVIRIDKKRKIATRVIGFAPESSTQKVFEAMGWTYEDHMT